MEQKELQKMIGEQIASIRKSKKFSQEDLSKMTNMRRSNICRIEKGNANCTIESLHRISTALNIKINQLINL